MMNFIIIAIFIILICWCIYHQYTKKIEGLQTFAGRLAIDDQYFYDQMFDDVYYYPNEKDGTTGWQRCKTECPGHCVEYFVSGIAYCFPY